MKMHRFLNNFLIFCPRRFFVNLCLCIISIERNQEQHQCQTTNQQWQFQNKKKLLFYQISFDPVFFSIGLSMFRFINYYLMFLFVFFYNLISFD